MTEDQGSGGLSRRTVVKAAAWSVPVLAIGAPAHAQTMSPIVQFVGSACKLPGNSNPAYKGYTAGLGVINPFNEGINIRVTDFKVNGSPAINLFIGVQLNQSAPNCVFAARGAEPAPCFPQGETLIAAYIADFPNSQNALIEVTYDVTYCGQATVLVSETFSFQLSGDPWNGGCRPHDPWPCNVPGTPTGVTIVDVDPNPVDCGARKLTITGQGFTGTTVVEFSPDLVTWTNAGTWEVVSDTVIESDVPCSLAGETVIVRVTSPAGSDTLPGLVIGPP